MKKILISDYDGTLYTDEKSMKNNVEMINKFREQGNLFVLATGRPYCRTITKVKKYKIPYDYLIVGNGSFVVDNRNKVIINNIIDGEVLKSIMTGLKNKEEVLEITYYGTYEQDEVIDYDNTTYIMLKVKNRIIADELVEYIRKNFSRINIYNSFNSDEYSLIDIISNNSQKSNAIDKIIKLENIDYNNVYTIGDSSNDVEMIMKYNGYGMTNSDERVIEVANKLYNNVYDLIEEVI